MTLDLRDYCVPKSLLLNTWNVPKDGVVLTAFRLFAVSLVMGPLLLIWAVVKTVRERQSQELSHP